MANNEQGTASSIADLFTKLSTFAVAAGWTQDFAASDRLLLHKGICFPSFRWASSSPTCAGIYQALAFVNSGTDPGNHTNDSGQGAVSGTDATILAGRSVPLVNSSMPYWFFTSGSADYVHVVVQVAAGDFRHFGFGNLTKAGTWTGGEYSYGWRYKQSGGIGSNAITLDSTMLLDAISGSVVGGGGLPNTMQPFASCVHAESLPNEGGSSKWALAWGGGVPSSNDRGGNARVFMQGGLRGGMAQVAFHRYNGSLVTGLVAMIPVNVWYRDPVNTTRWYRMGQMPDVRQVRMDAFVGGQEVTVSTDTWIVFPAKALTTFGAANTRSLGVAYLKVP